MTYTLSAGVGEIGVRGLQLARIQSLDLGTLQVRNVPVLVKSPALRGMPKPESESFSPLAIGLSMTIDYGQRLLTIGSRLPPFEARSPPADAHSPPGDGARAAQRQPPGLLRCRHRRRSHLDQLGHRAAAAAVAVSADSAARMGARPGGIATRSCSPASISSSTASNTAIILSSF